MGKDPRLAGRLPPVHVFGEMPEHLAVVLTAQTCLLRCQPSTELARPLQEDSLLVISQGCHDTHPHKGESRTRRMKRVLEFVE
jgi:hypothetical protein